MLGPFDRYTLVEIGVAAGVDDLFVLISWWQQPPRRKPGGMKNLKMKRRQPR
jgi:hypothetical protein